MLNYCSNFARTEFYNSLGLSTSVPPCIYFENYFVRKAEYVIHAYYS